MDTIDYRYSHYRAVWIEQHNGHKLTQLLPFDKLSLINIQNSFIINPINRVIIGKCNISKNEHYKVVQSILKISHGFDTVFQIVKIDNEFYINPFFKQPNEVLKSKIIKVGNIHKGIKNNIQHLNRLMGNESDNRPHWNSICVKGQFKPTQLSRKCESLNNPIFNTSDFVKLLKESSIGIYF